jgi:cytochrome c oxidase cbb3-type subunit 3
MLFLHGHRKPRNENMQVQRSPLTWQRGTPYDARAMWVWRAVVVACMSLLPGPLTPASAQTPASAAAPKPPLKNPLDGDATAIRAGGARFQAGCAECHGADAKGIFGPNLTTLWVTGLTDERIYQTVKAGVPGSSMPSSRLGDDEIWGILAYLRTLSPKEPPPPETGDAASGERIFRVNCASCHRVNGRGGRLGPDLSRIGSSRSREGLIRDIRHASAVIVPGYRGVTMVTADGGTIQGAVKSEDAFSIRIMDTREELRGFVKSDLKSFTEDARSLMPDFGEARLSAAAMDDLLRYLSTLRPPVAPRP